MRTNRWAVVFATALLVAGCGSDEGKGGAQHGASIIISPSGIDNTYDGTDVGAFLDPVTVTVVNEAGNPLRDTDVEIHAWSGVITTDALGNNVQPYPYNAKTDDFGNVHFYVYTPLIYNIGTTNTALQAFSGSAYNTIDITMTCTDINTSTTTVCD